MPTEQSDLQSVLVETARILARGGQLEARLDALAAQVARVTRASTTVVYLLDAEAGSLIAAGGSGLSEEALAAAIVSLRDATDPIARAALERETIVAAADDPAAATALGRLGGSIRTLTSAPLIAEEVAGAVAVQGVLAAGFDGDMPPMPDLGDLLSAMADLAAVIIRDARFEHALMERSEWLERMAATDPLTGLANRRTFDRMLELEVARAARLSTPTCVALFEADGLPGIVEREGPRVGDDTLRQVATTLAEQVRVVDTAARLDGSEFALIAPGHGGETVAQRVREAVGLLRTPAGQPVSLSAGVSRFPDQGQSPEELLETASRALARARMGQGIALAWDEATPA